MEDDLEVGRAGHRDRLARPVLDQLIDVPDAVPGHGGAAELEHHPVEPGVAPGPDVDEGRGGLGAGGRGRHGQDDGGETGDDEGPDEPHGDHLL